MKHPWGGWLVLWLGAFLIMGLRGVAADIGTYKARVSALDGTYGLYNPGGGVLNGTYNLPVVIEDDEVTKIVWTDGSHIEVANGTLHGLQASVMSYKGQRFLIEVTDDRFHREDTANDNVSDSQPDDGS